MMNKIAKVGNKIEYLGQEMTVTDMYYDDMWIIEVQWFDKNSKHREMEIYPAYWRFIVNKSKEAEQERCDICNGRIVQCGDEQRCEKCGFLIRLL